MGSDQSSFQPLASPHHPQHMPYEEYMIKTSAYWHFLQGIISFSTNLCFSEQGFELVRFSSINFLIAFRLLAWNPSNNEFCDLTA